MHEGKRLRALLDERGLTLTALAEAGGVTVAAAGKWGAAETIGAGAWETCRGAMRAVGLDPRAIRPADPDIPEPKAYRSLLDGMTHRQLAAVRDLIAAPAHVQADLLAYLDGRLDATPPGGVSIRDALPGATKRGVVRDERAAEQVAREGEATTRSSDTKA